MYQGELYSLYSHIVQLKDNNELIKGNLLNLFCLKKSNWFSFVFLYEISANGAGLYDRAGLIAGDLTGIRRSNIAKYMNKAD